MKLILTTDDGEVLDSTEISRADWDRMTSTALGAFDLLSWLTPGDAERGE